MGAWGSARGPAHGRLAGDGDGDDAGARRRPGGAGSLLELHGNQEAAVSSVSKETDGGVRAPVLC